MPPKKKKTKAQTRIILAMVLLNDEKALDIKTFRKDFKTNYGKAIKNPDAGDNSVAFNVDGELVAIGHMPVPVPKAGIKRVAEYAYNWDTATQDLKDHKSHLIVTLTGDGQDQVKRYRLFTQVICSLLRTTNSIGVYQGNQSLLTPKYQYLGQAAIMSDDYCPLNLWIYFGYVITTKGNSVYTFGLKEFGKNEMEIVNSSRPVPQIISFLFNMTHYVLDFDVTFKAGQTCGMSAKEKIPISFSKGKFIEGKTFKLAY